MSIKFSHTFIPPFLSVLAKYFKSQILFLLIMLGVLKDEREGPLLQRIKIIKFFSQKIQLKKKVFPKPGLLINCLKTWAMK